MNEAGGAEEPSKAERSGPHAHRDSLNEDACRTIPCTLDHCGVERRRFGATRGISPPQVTSNGEAERRAVFSAPNKGTLSRTSTFQRASPRLTRATAPAIVRRRIVRWRKRSRKRPQMRALPHAYVSTLPVRILRRAHTSRASTTMNRPMRRFLTLCCAPGSLRGVQIRRLTVSLSDERRQSGPR